MGRFFRGWLRGGSIVVLVCLAAGVRANHGSATPELPGWMLYDGNGRDGAINPDAAPWEKTFGDDDWFTEIRVPANTPAGAAYEGLGLSPGSIYAARATGVFNYDTRAHAGPLAAAGQGEPARLADAECSIDRTVAGGERWVPHRYPGAERDILDLEIRSGSNIVSLDWTPEFPFPPGSASGDPACSRTHAYGAAVPWTLPTPQFYVYDGTYAGQDFPNSGFLDLRLDGPGPVFTRHYQCPKWASDDIRSDLQIPTREVREATLKVDAFGGSIPHDGDHGFEFWQKAGRNGIFTCNWLVRGHWYRFDVTGTVDFQAPTNGLHASADAECARLAEVDWARYRFWSTSQPSDRHDTTELHVNTYGVPWQPTGFSATAAGCSNNAGYWWYWWADASSPVHLKFYEFEGGPPHDNQGHFEVKITRATAAEGLADFQNNPWMTTEPRSDQGQFGTTIGPLRVI